MARSKSRLDRSAFSVKTFAEADDDDRAYWHSLSPQERLAALEKMRRLNYDYDPAADRIQRTLEVAQQA
ncbi:MAG TPA: hypothetical protein VJB15_01920 [Rhodothermia bacterium]|nr:hypothetical protein [Rhodothermia bacterium]